MRKNVCVMICALVVSIVQPAHARYITECFGAIQDNGDEGQNEGVRYNDGHEDRCCLTDGTSCGSVDLFWCCGAMGWDSNSCPWSGATYGAGEMLEAKSCFLNISEGECLSDIYDAFDESRSTEELIIDCYSGRYCPGGSFSYNAVKDYSGKNTLCAFSASCPDATNMFADAALTKVVTDGTGIKSLARASRITDCYVGSGTYYDETGTFLIESDESCFY